MKKIINLLKAHGVEVHEGSAGNYFVNDCGQDLNINFWDVEETLDFLGYDPLTIEQMLNR